MPQPRGRKQPSEHKLTRRGRAYAEAGLTVDEKMALLSTLLNYSPDGLAFIDSNLIVRVANERIADELNLPLGQTVGHSMEGEAVEVTAEIRDIFRRVRATGQPFRAQAYPFIFRRQPERGVTYWETTVSPVYNADGPFQGWLLRLRDITERRRAEEQREALLAEVRQTVAELDASITSMPEGIIIYDRTGAIIRSNPAVRQLLGYVPKEFDRPLIERSKTLRAETIDGHPISVEEAPLVRALRGEVVRVGQTHLNGLAE